MSGSEPSTAPLSEVVVLSDVVVEDEDVVEEDEVVEDEVVVELLVVLLDIPPPEQEQAVRLSARISASSPTAHLRIICIKDTSVSIGSASYRLPSDVVCPEFRASYSPAAVRQAFLPRGKPVYNGRASPGSPIAALRPVSEAPSAA